jgi:multidrug efflux pump subunit AcrB
VAGLRSVLPIAQKQLPPELTVTPLFDQSLFVRARNNGV